MAKERDTKRTPRTRGRRIGQVTRLQAASHLELAREAYRSRQYADSIAHAEKALRIYPGYMSAHALLAEVYFNHQRDYSRGSRHFQFLIEHKHPDRSLPFFLGLCHFETGQYRQARETFAGFLEHEKGKRLPARLQTVRSQVQGFIEPEPRSIAVSFSFGEEGLCERLHRQDYQSIEDYLLSLQ